MASPAPISGLRGVAQPVWAVGAGEWEKAPMEAVVDSLHGDTMLGHCPQSRAGHSVRLVGTGSSGETQRGGSLGHTLGSWAGE